MGFKNDKSPSRGTVRPTAYKKKLKKKRSVRCSRSSAIGGGEGKSGGVPLGSREGLNSFFAMEGERRRVDLHSGREGGG